MKYETYKYEGKWFWRIRNQKKEVVVRCCRSYPSKAAATRSLSSLTTEIAKDWNTPSGISGCGRGVMID